MARTREIQIEPKRLWEGQEQQLALLVSFLSLDSFVFLLVLCVLCDCVSARILFFPRLGPWYAHTHTHTRLTLTFPYWATYGDPNKRQAPNEL